jgi:DNA-binding MarR family transcriptional regulator
MNDTEQTQLEHLEILTLKLGWAFHRQMEQDLECFDLTLPQYITLRYLAECHTQYKLSDLAGATHHVLPTLTGIVDRLEAHGLVTRQRMPTDRRAWTLVLTPAGKDLLEEVRQQRHAWVAQLLQDQPPANRETIERGLALCFEAICTQIRK